MVRLRQGQNLLKKVSQYSTELRLTIHLQRKTQRCLAEAAFVGFFGGAAAGGAGAGLVTTAERVPGAANSALDTAASVTAKARDLLDKAQGQRVDNDITREQYGDTMTAAQLVSHNAT